MPDEIYVKGYREFVRACTHSSAEVRKGLRAALREAGNLVRDEARSLFSKYDERSASKYGTTVRQSGVSVEQRLRRVTGKRPDYGALQMRRALLPARGREMPKVEQGLERMLDEIDF